ncbi:hypothetical protein DY218_12915 [Streptomyces triticagri]|uniref:Secreted protein n=1 Tax=Streptomyces triticagri TaxID=2293568 RepID=A0A372M794_9ACTN|nr:hypothetical protein [Streptomyces triticagri]RFU86303.1 hypothetical protein DY218_12915 [Streptomyces triticagri]
MRTSRKAGLLVSTAVCGALALGAAGPAFAATSDSTVPSDSTSVAAPVPGADALAQQSALLGNAGGVLTPVTALVDAVLKADDGKLTEADATKHADAIKAALAKVTEAAPETPAAGALPGPAAADPGTELKAKAAAALQVKVDALIKASLAGDVKVTAAAVQATITATVNVLVSIVLGGGLPAADLPGLPTLPTIPGVAEVPTLPTL